MNVGDRILIEEENECCGGDDLFECKIVEISPSGESVKVFIEDDNRFYKKWYKVKAVLEVLEGAP